MRETKGIMCSAQCGRFTGCGVGADPLPQEASSVLEYSPATRDSHCWILCSYTSHFSCSNEVIPNQTDLNHNHTEGLSFTEIFFQ